MRDFIFNSWYNWAEKKNQELTSISVNTSSYLGWILVYPLDFSWVSPHLLSPQLGLCLRLQGLRWDSPGLDFLLGKKTALTYYVEKKKEKNFQKIH